MSLYFALVPRSVLEIIMLFLICVFASPLLIKKICPFLYVDFFYFVTLQKVCANSNNFLVVPLEPFKFRAMPSPVKGTFISCAICVLLFLSLFSLS